MSGPRTASVIPRAASAPARGARRQAKRNSQALLVAGLTLLATGIAFYDLVVFAVALR